MRRESASHNPALEVLLLPAPTPPQLVSGGMPSPAHTQAPPGSYSTWRNGYRALWLVRWLSDPPDRERETAYSPPVVVWPVPCVSTPQSTPKDGPAARWFPGGGEK